MTHRGLLKFTSATLFAIVCMVALHFVAWFAGISQAEKMLVERLESLRPIQMEYSAIRKSGYPFSINLHIDDFKIKWFDKTGKNGLVYHVGDLAIVTEFLGDQRLEVDLPKFQSMDVVANNKVAKSFGILVEGGKLGLFAQDRDAEATLSVSNVTAFNQNDPDSPVFKATSTHISKATTSGRLTHNRDWTLRFNSSNMVVGKELVPDGQDLQAITTDVEMRNISDALGGFVVPLLTGKLSGPQAVEVFTQGLAENNGFVRFNNVHVRHGDFWFTMRGEVGVDKRLRPEGNMSITTNVIDYIMLFMRQKNLLNDVAFNQSRLLARILTRDAATMNISLQMSRGAMLINGVPVGIISPLPELVKSAQVE